MFDSNTKICILRKLRDRYGLCDAYIAYMYTRYAKCSVRRIVVQIFQLVYSHCFSYTLFVPCDECAKKKRTELILVVNGICQFAGARILDDSRWY